MGNATSTSASGSSASRLSSSSRSLVRIRRGANKRKLKSAKPVNQKNMQALMESKDLNEIENLIALLKQDKEGQGLLDEFVGHQASKSTEFHNKRR